MAISDVLKVHIACPSGLNGKVFEALQKWGRLEIFSKKEVLPDDSGNLKHTILELEFINDYLKNYGQKASPWKRLQEGLPRVDSRHLKKIKNSTDIHNDYRHIRNSQKQLRLLHDRLEDSKHRLNLLQRIKSLKLKGKTLTTVKSKTLVISASHQDVQAIKQSGLIISREISEGPPAILALTFLKEDERKVSAELEKLSLHIFDIPEDKTPLQEIHGIEKTIKSSEREIDDIHREIKSNYYKKAFDYIVLLDYYENLLARETEYNKALSTSYTRIISAWCPAVFKKELIQLIESLDSGCHIEFEKPSADESPPVLLRNGAFSESFEVVTDLYGTPSYNWVDPTPHLSFFFAFFFGLCLGDAGYGLILVGLAVWALKSLKISQAAKKFMKLMLFSGIAAVVAGILSGGWFGDALDGVAAVEKLRVINLMERPEYFLYFSIGLGFIQVLYGQFISAMEKIKRGRVKESLYEDFSKMLFVIGVSFFMVNSIAVDNAFLGRSSAYMGGAGLLGIIFLSGHSAKNIFLRPLKGLGNLYGMTDYFKDMVSYSRIFALGMATAILGMAINEISKQLPAMVGIIGYIVIPFVLIIGHLVINLLMSCLSGYVHTSRLQYVEFFTRFFEGGGKRFTPFRTVEKRVNFAGK